MATKINYRNISKDELDQILEAHKKWVESKGEEGAMANLSEVDLERFDLRDVVLSEANLVNTDLVKTDLRLSNLQGAILQGANLTEANLQGANLQGANLHGANLTEANLQGADLQGANLQNAILIDAILQRTNLQETNFQRADLRLGNIQGADLQRADLQSANLQGASLQGAKLQGAKLQGSNLHGAGLQGADLQGVNLQGADLQSANLQDANLQGANLIEAHLENADLEGGQINGCIGFNVNVKGAKFFVDQIEDLKTWGESIKGKSQIHFRFRGGEPTEYPHVLYMLFPGYENLIEFLKEIEKELPGPWSFINRKFENDVLFSLEVLRKDTRSLVDIGCRTLSKMEKIDEVITNLPALIGRIHLSLEEQKQAIEELGAHDSQLVRNLANTVQELNENNLELLVDTLNRIQKKGIKTTIEDKIKLAGLLREGLERNQSKQRFRETLKSLLPTLGLGTASSAAVTALTASGGIDVNAAMLAGGGLLAWALAVINQYMESPPQTDFKQIPLMGWDGDIN